MNVNEQDREDDRAYALIMKTLDTSLDSRRIESATSHGPCVSRFRAHVRVFARKSAAVDPAATRGMRTRRDATLLTTFAMKGDEERIRESGCEAYLSKPISVPKFIETIRRRLGVDQSMLAVNRSRQAERRRRT
jgi:hypothetical protein